MPNFRTFYDYEYLASEDFTKEVVLEIERFEKKEIFSKRENKTKSALVLYFKNVKKGFVCNITNARTITKIANSSDVKDWIGLKIILYAKSDVDYYNEKVAGIRVKLKKVE